MGQESKMKKKILGLAVVIAVTFCSISISREDCLKACAKFLFCTEELNKRKATDAEKDKLNKGCSESCKKYTDKILECYGNSLKSGGSCTTYGQCIYKYGTAAKKK